MAFGPGKYGARAATLLREVHARTVIVVTVGGDAGNAFDVATVDALDLLRLPTILREIATSIEDDMVGEDGERTTPPRRGGT